MTSGSDIGWRRETELVLQELSHSKKPAFNRLLRGKLWLVLWMDFQGSGELGREWFGIPSEALWTTKTHILIVAEHNIQVPYQVGEKIQHLEMSSLLS
ncbi:uncharacterized protein PADG_11287 [Paracoccidioides brasiliensis Pb18]|uniref:Uncharacterized protein n=2 Tax=Paracoccidioides brasiliensis TaxID=121759 RepID=A0A0A0HWL3_PARBD|nr:uncharacterized protein PADG_11287 [Paracoccidioides brasiliensis Pb18]KGM92466.1 hypothetical protein PADG_11287 [Paracoccidioides brasiliensis Pb18]ODH43336.1 hypothetical protein ACO22_01056 [Paracoccidioides brasiliensis]